MEMKGGLLDSFQGLIMAFIFHIGYNPFSEGGGSRADGGHGSYFGGKAVADKRQKPAVGEQAFPVFFDRKYNAGQAFGSFRINVAALGIKDRLYTCDYQKWIFIGSPFIMMANGFVHLFRSVGLIKESTIGLVLGNAVNMVLDYVFIAVLGWGPPERRWQRLWGLCARRSII